MRATHLTDEELQQYVLDRDFGDTGINMHIHSCEQCREKAEGYRLLVTGLRNQPAESFDFSLTEIVMQQLPVPSPAVNREKESTLIYAIMTVAVAIIGFALYFFRKYMTGIFERIAPVFIYLVLTAFMTLSIFLVTDIYKRYKKKMHALNLYRG